MINRSKELEKKLMDLLEEASKTDDNKGCAIIVNAVIALYKATSEKEYADKAKQMLDKYAVNVAELAKEDGIHKYLWGNVFYNIGDYSGDVKYIDMAVELAA